MGSRVLSALVQPLYTVFLIQDAENLPSGSARTEESPLILVLRFTCGVLPPLVEQAVHWQSGASIIVASECRPYSRLANAATWAESGTPAKKTTPR
jgi:hypothetical protein